MGMAAALGAPVFASDANSETNAASRLQPVIEESVSAAHGYDQVISRAFLDDEVPTASATIPFLADQEWNDATEQRFHELAVAEALEELTSEQSAELEFLTRLRAQKAAPPKTLDELILEIRQWKATVSLLSQLSNYVRVIGPRI